MGYEVVIGIEVHCELKTKTKMFSGAASVFGAQPNTCVGIADMALPGSLPVVNKEAVRLALLACKALNCEVDTLVRFDRKSYFYSDLPKGFQITQQFHPIGSRGYLMVNDKKIRINRLHMEEDTAKQFHEEDGTYIDFNRSSTPLIEIVSEADIRSKEEAMQYVENLRLNLLYAGVSDVKMEEGSLRCDINISLRPEGTETFGTKVEIKNLNSISNVGKAIDYEIQRQTEILQQGGHIEQQTRRFDEESKTTVLMRTKVSAVSYRYLVEPNILPIRLDETWIQAAYDSLPELPAQRITRYQEYGLATEDIKVLISNKPLSDFFDETVKHTNDYRSVANWLLQDVLGYVNKNQITIETIQLKPQHLATLIEMIDHHDISGKQAKVVFEDMMLGEDPKAVAKKRNLVQNSDEASILAFVTEALVENPQAIEDFKNGKDRAVGFIVGQVMKKSKGQANPAMTSKLVQQELKKR